MRSALCTAASSEPPGPLGRSSVQGMPFMKFRPNLYRTVRVVLSDGSTFRQPSAVRQVGEMLALERDTANHPVYLGLGDLSGMVDRREEARLLKIAQRRARREGVEEEEE